MKDFAGGTRCSKETLPCDSHIDEGVVVEVFNQSLDDGAACCKECKEREGVAFQFLEYHSVKERAGERGKRRGGR